MIDVVFHFPKGAEEYFPPGVASVPGAKFWTAHLRDRMPAAPQPGQRLYFGRHGVFSVYNVSWRRNDVGWELSVSLASVMAGT